MLRITVLVGVVVVVLGACFKPAIEREVVEDGDAEVEVGEAEVGPEDTGEVEGGDTSELDVDVDGTTEVDTDSGDISDTALGDAAETAVCEGAVGAPCDDGEPCTRDDQCGRDGCAGIPYVCDDGLACTQDLCDGSGGCTEALLFGFCKGTGECVALGEQDSTGCLVCTAGGLQPAREGAPCTPLEACRTEGVCVGGTCIAPVSCLDANICTIGVCGEAGACEQRTHISGLAVMSLAGIWARVPHGGDVLSRFGVWSTQQTSVAMNLAHFEPGSSGVPGYEFVTLGDKAAVVLTYGVDGDLAWYNSISAASGQSSEVVAIDAGDHLVVAGSASVGVDFNGAYQSPNTGPADTRPFFVASYGANGRPTWIQRFEGSESIIGVSALANGGAGLVLLQDQAAVVIPGSSSLLSSAPVSGSRIVLRIRTDNTGKGLSARRLVRFGRNHTPEVVQADSGSSVDATVLAIGRTNSAFSIGESPTITVDQSIHDRVVVASFNANGQATWIREFVAAGAIRLKSISSGPGGRVLVAVEGGAARVSLRSPDAYLGEFGIEGSAVFGFDAAGALAGQLTLNSVVETVAVSHGLDNAIVSQNRASLVASVAGTEYPLELPNSGDLVVIFTTESLQPIGFAEIASGNRGGMTSILRDSRFYISQPSVDAVVRLGSVEGPLTPLQSAPGRALFVLSATVCE
ncbi:MAG TPA: hypothetical protein PK095_10110 [Myxococcota bacterium]|nr:hypothetical protein [Myxococcota bacterium]